MAKHNQLVELNDLVLADDGVYYKGVVPEEFNYSDGVDVEQTLHKILSSATDLSSQSEELQTQISDWPTEYHLSSARSNLLRAIDLTKAKRVLELGCGCGSITRYLGEQEHLTIDSVEGSAVRAKLAALRCRDLQNITITSANFNELSLPENYYDLVIFVGVTEYAGRFSDRDSDQQALQDMLAMAHRATTSEGVTLIAIENRVGLKYLHGANEDHYAVPYVGLKDYPDSQGIRTYSKVEWQDQLEAANFVDIKYLYPFPDYKVPTVILNDDNAKNVKQVEQTLAHIKSRDYGSDFSLGEQELTLWTALASAQTLAEHANSFLILVAKSKGVLEKSVAECPIENEVQVPSYLDRIADRDRQANLDRQETLQGQAEIERKNDTIRQLNSELQETRNYLKLLEGSKGGKVLAFLRRCIGRRENVKTKS